MIRKTMTMTTISWSSNEPNSTHSSHLGFFRFALETQVFLTIIYSLTTLLSVLGNILAIVVFTVGRRSRTDLRLFLINLAAADLIMAIFCMPFTFTNTMLDDWVFSSPMCPIVLYMQTVSVTVSVCTITAIGIDRFWVVYYPLKSRITKSRSKTIMISIWLVAGILCIVQLLVGRTEKRQGLEFVMECTEIWPEPKDLYRRSYTLFVMGTTYLLPLVALTITYGLVCRKLWTHTAPGNADSSRDFQQLRSKKKIIKMLVLVVTLFGVCWLPLHVFILLYDFNKDAWKAQMDFYVAIYYCVHWLALSNSFVNPIIYVIFNKSFRRDLKWILCCGPCGLNSCKKARENKNSTIHQPANPLDGAWDLHATTQQSFSRQGQRVR